MSINELKVTARSETGKGASRKLRRTGQIPAILYGLNKEPQQITISSKELDIALRSESQIIELVLDKNNKISALIKDIQYNHLISQTVHVDFQAINMNEEITAFLTIHPKGTPAGLSQGGVFEQRLHEIEVSCMAKELPESLPVDVSGMKINDVFYAKDLALPENMTLIDEPDAVLFTLSQPKVKEETSETEEGEEAATEGKSETAKGEE